MEQLDVIAEYYQILKYDFDERKQNGLLRYYNGAFTIGELDRVPVLRFMEVDGL